MCYASDVRNTLAVQHVALTDCSLILILVRRRQTLRVSVQQEVHCSNRSI